MAGYRIDRQLATFGEHVRGWRMLAPPMSKIDAIVTPLVDGVSG